MLQKKILRFIFLILCSIFLTPTVFAAVYPLERIYSFDSNIIVNENASIDVTETITVFANQENITHGIVRRLLTQYRDSYGALHRTHYQIQRILFNGVNAPYHIQNENHFFSIFIGDPNIFLPRGYYTYTLQYQASNAVNFLKDADELYWNITGNYWEFSIDSAKVTITLPAGAGIISQAGYTGYLGLQGKDFTVSQPSTNQIIFSTTRMLQPSEGLTIAVAWPKGFVHPPTWRELLAEQLDVWDYIVIEMAALLIIYFLVVWYFYGRDPAKGTIVPLFEPPANLTPETMRYIFRMRFDMKVFTAAIVNLATEGYLTIENNDDVFSLTEKEQSKDKLATEEKMMVYDLFSSGSPLTLTQKNYTQITSARANLDKSLRYQYQKDNFITNSVYLIPGIFITLLAFSAVIFSSDDVHKAASTVFSLSFWTFACGIMLFKAFHSIELAKISGSFKKIISAITSNIFVIPFLIAEVVLIYTFSTVMPIYTMPLLFFMVVLNIVFHQLLKAPTLAGRKLMDQIEGFKLFLSTTERYRLNQLNPPKKTPELFEKYLPYAIALDVENEWGAQFVNVLREASVLQNTNTYQPSWYSGPTLEIVSFAALPHLLSTVLSNSFSSFSVSSSARGGGSSGGGGGGGGGGGW